MSCLLGFHEAARKPRACGSHSILNRVHRQLIAVSSISLQQERAHPFPYKTSLYGTMQSTAFMGDTTTLRSGVVASRSAGPVRPLTALSSTASVVAA